MAFLLLEGFDHLTNSQLPLKSWSGAAFSAGAGRFAGQSMQVPSGTVTKSFAASATVIAGVAIKLGAFTSGQDIFVLRSGATLAVRVSVNASNILQVRNSGGTVIATGTTPLVSNAWNYVEIKAFINGASGTCELHLNGVAGEIASTVGNFGSTNLDSIGIIGTSTSSNPSFDDIYIVDTTGAAPRNTFLGDVRIATIFPTSDGAHLQWTPSTGVTHFNLVNETTPDGDTSFVSDATPGDLDTYGFGDVDAGATVFGVQKNLYARKDDANARQIAPVVRQAGVDSAGTTFTLTSTYQFWSQIDNQDPTASDWTAATVNADEFGVKTIA